MKTMKIWVLDFVMRAGVFADPITFARFSSYLLYFVKIRAWSLHATLLIVRPLDVCGTFSYVCLDSESTDFQQ